MADHGQVEYATATGNDLAEHEATYKNFVQLAYVGSCAVASIVIALAIVGTTSHWGIAVEPHHRGLDRVRPRPCQRVAGSEWRHGGDLAARSCLCRVGLSAGCLARDSVSSEETG